MTYRPLPPRKPLVGKERARSLNLCLIEDEGFTIHAFSETHYRIEHRWDFWPTTGKWWDTKYQLRGYGVDGLIREIKKYKQK